MWPGEKLTGIVHLHLQALSNICLSKQMPSQYWEGMMLFNAAVKFARNV